MIKYKIVEVNSNQHSITVRYYTDTITEAMLATDTLDGVIRRCRTDYSIDLPIPAPTGTELDTFILKRAPVAWLATQEAVLDVGVDTTMSNLQTLIGVESVAAPIVLTPAQVEAQFIKAIQGQLDDFAKTRNYDGILSACTYATSTVAAFAVEGQYCVQARDLTWMAAYVILADVNAGTRPMPTIEAVLTELPALAWPA